MVGTIGWAMALAGDAERGLAVMAKGQALNPRHPGWFHMAPCFDHLRRGELAAALEAAQAINMPALAWDPLLRASILGLLGRADEARAALGELLALDPEFPRHARRYLAGYIFQDELAEQVAVGSSSPAWKRRLEAPSGGPGGPLPDATAPTLSPTAASRARSLSSPGSGGLRRLFADARGVSRPGAPSSGEEEAPAHARRTPARVVAVAE